VKLQLAIDQSALAELVAKQLRNLLVFEDGERDDLAKGIDAALKRCEFCFAASALGPYHKGGAPWFSPFHTSQNTVFLYYLSRALDQAGSSLGERVYYLNKILHGVDLFCQVSLPDIFLVDHAVGTVMGRATYSNYLIFLQNCTVGNNRGRYPSLGEYNALFAGATVLGGTRSGKYCFFSAGSVVVDEEIPDCSVVFGRSPHLAIKRKPESYFVEFLKDFWTIA
jgi:serine O-acetyltransferase